MTRAEERRRAAEHALAAAQGHYAATADRREECWQAWLARPDDETRRALAAVTADEVAAYAAVHRAQEAWDRASAWFDWGAGEQA